MRKPDTSLCCRRRSRNRLTSRLQPFYSPACPASPGLHLTVGAWTTSEGPARDPLYLPLPSAASLLESCTLRTAVFVDAGYLYAAGVQLLGGETLPRSCAQLDIAKVRDALRALAEELPRSESLLRIYWYDGMPRSGHTAEQMALADSDDIKLRLGMIAYTGRQKGVDSLIVTDLIELARNRAISDAILLSGDEDVRIGVQIAQSFGVRVHLLAIEPGARNQSRLLRQESDTAIEWGKSRVGMFLSVPPCHAAQDRLEADGLSMRHRELESAVAEFIDQCTPDERLLISQLQPAQPIPAHLDGKLLRCAAQTLERLLESEERIGVRSAAKRIAGERHSMG